MLENLNSTSLTTRREIDTRIEGLQKRMSKAGIDYAVILQNVDLFYFTGTLQKGVLIIPACEPPLYFVEKNLYRAVRESPLEIIPIKKDKDVGEMLKGRPTIKGRCGMELDVLPVSLFERWKAILGVDNVADISPLIKDVRLIKSEFEIAQIIKSGAIITRVFEKAKDVIKEGLREIDIDAALLAEGRRVGHQGYLRMRGFNQEMMCGYVTHGWASTISSGADVPISGIGVTHATSQGASINTVQRGVPVVVDYGGGYNGYITDETRVYSVGPLQDIYCRGYDTARAIIEDSMGFAKEGTDAVELYLSALERAKRAGLEENFMGHGEGQVSFLGHGLGLEINELPVFTARHSMILKEGMVFALEPKFIIPGKGAVGIEVDFVVRKDGLERVTDSSFDAVII